MTLGELRAVILRKGNRPVSMGKLADLLHCTAGSWNRPACSPASGRGERSGYCARSEETHWWA
ncbi:hypothetical protein QFZ82_002197 [Streptomyces sp. V4I23]|uniref:hypothetical protein n=1 Tax=Streptomyces sp. V4I23 TaxID=3042282 RepID=UPI002783E066|nr:hypothetical protein [Streptomyces sp. V4I23]MDQ1007712.1 hypothetical protein [Streptomyces sp. V4I23]